MRIAPSLPATADRTIAWGSASSSAISASPAGRGTRRCRSRHRSIVSYIAGQLDLDPAHLEAYASRDPTRREHLAEIQRVFGFRPFSLARYRELSRWLLPTALATDVGVILVGALIDEMRLRQIIIPALSTLEGLVWETRRRARRQVYARLTANLSLDQQAQLEALLDVVPELRQTRLTWLRQPPGASKPATVLKLSSASNSFDPSSSTPPSHARSTRTGFSNWPAKAPA